MALIRKTIILALKERIVLEVSTSSYAQTYTSIALFKELWLAKKPFILALFIVTVVSFSGLSIIVYYAVNIFELFESGVDSQVASIFVGITLIASSLTSTIMVSRVNRRMLFIW
jgi:hypothetical protein